MEAPLDRPDGDPGTRAQVEFFKMFATWRTAVGSAMTRPSAI